MPHGTLNARSNHALILKGTFQGLSRSKHLNYSGWDKATVAKHGGVAWIEERFCAVRVWKPSIIYYSGIRRLSAFSVAANYHPLNILHFLFFEQRGSLCVELSSIQGVLETFQHAHNAAITEKKKEEACMCMKKKRGTDNDLIYCHVLCMHHMDSWCVTAGKRNLFFNLMCSWCLCVPAWWTTARMSLSQTAAAFRG